MTEFKKETLKINGVDTVVYTAGEGEPLLFLHGAGTFHGFEFAKSWAAKFKVIHPYHPGFGESGDDAAMDTFNDYVMHYVDLLDALGIDKVHLVGFSLGGFLAAQFASQQRDRVKTLTLVAPAGMKSAEHPTIDVLSTPGDQLVGMLASNFEVLKPWLPTGPDPEFMGARYRESTTVARLLWEKPWDQKFKRYLHRINAPTLIIWGDEDRIVPHQQAALWQQALPSAKVQIFKGAGHIVLDEQPEAANAVMAHAA
ncbi:MAG: alpha/beta hydrolase [Rhizobium sp.]|nr:alpha/beta hydrolase [Rhizobium sp.]